MSRYIDVDKKLTITVYDDEHEENIDRYMTIEEILDTYTSEGCPTTADVVEVVHGKWIKTTIAEGCGTDELHRTVYRDRETVKCSECGNPSPIYNIKFEFCPHCGAKMDERRKDADALKRKIETMYREPDIQENLPYNLAIAEVLEVIDEFPSANVVEVVRCEKCAYGHLYPNDFNVYCRKRRNMVYANDFCSEGERIDE